MGTSILNRIQEALIQSLMDFYADRSWDCETENLVDHFTTLGKKMQYVRGISTLSEMFTKIESGELENMGIMFIDKDDLDGYLKRIISSKE